MPSVSFGKVALAASCLPLLGGLTACETTQETSARLKIRADRILASRQSVGVEKANPQVDVVDAAALRSGKDVAIAVTLRNTGSRPVNDLPLAVGLETAEGRVLVNRGTSFRYFEAHSPVLEPRRATTWVLTLPTAKLPRGEAPVVRVGLAPSSATVATTVPRVQVSRIVSTRGKRKATVAATIANESGFPQYDLSVYAWAKSDGRYVAAAQKPIGNLGTGKSTRVKLDLIGNPGKSQVHVSAPPTIFE